MTEVESKESKESKEKSLTVKQFFSFLLKECAPHKLSLFVIFFAIIYSVVFSLACPLMYKILFDDVIPNKNVNTLIIVACVLIGGLVILSGTQTLRSWLNSKLGASLSNNLRQQMLEYTNSDLLKHNFKKSNYLQAFNSDIAILEYYLCHRAFNVFGSALTSALGLILLFVLNWPLAITVILVMATVGPLSAMISKKVDPANEIKKQYENRLNLSADESVDLNEATFSLRLKNHWNGVNKDQLTCLSMPSTRYHFFSSATSFVPGLMISTVIVSLLLGGAALALYGYFTVGELIAFLTLFGNVAGSFNGIVRAIPLITQARLALSNMQPYLKEEKEEEVQEERPDLTNNITIENAYFSYDNKTQHLNNINLNIKQGEWVAFVGGSGSGKSTLLKLIAQFIKPTNGKILFDGIDISHISKDSQFHDSRIVFQEPKLYTMSIKDNILLSNPKATFSEIEDACKKAQVHEDIMKTPDQYDTIVGKEGVSGLSGGQLQRITIARALISDPQLMYLDEATSALDPKSVSKILDFIEQARGKHTFIHVCHDLRKIKTCDQIVVMDTGSIIEVGNHDQLIKNNGKYKKMWDIQQGVDIGDDDHTFSIDATTLKRIPLLADLDNDYLESLGKDFDIQHAEEGEVIIHENTTGQNFYIVSSGRVNITKVIDKRETKLATLEIGAFFGEISLIKSSPTTATVTADQYCVLLRLSKSKFNAFIDSLPEMQKKLINNTIKKRLATQH